MLFFPTTYLGYTAANKYYSNVKDKSIKSLNSLGEEHKETWYQ